ncbi:hypothetical protein CcCBS67573_g07524 [Chytriomyces confervae]|uniref:Uncharacterized protein n=1 Tax=Chytriomyces confervae TaxID=246404 RepID=A0A507EVE0_9FUNG|nr:hypothetical protein CcCBS67573_g07524 [Chytriomyces confervae]
MDFRSLYLREAKRQMQLPSLVEKLHKTKESLNGFKTALALKAAKREEELKASGNNIKVIESSIIENGKVVGTMQEILRERYAKTDAEAEKLVGWTASSSSASSFEGRDRNLD